MPKIQLETFNSKQRFETFSQKVLKSVKNKANLSAPIFTNQLKEVGDVFVERNQKELMNKYKTKEVRLKYYEDNKDSFNILYDD